MESKNNNSVITPAAIRPKALSPCIVQAVQGEPVCYCEEDMGFTKLDSGIIQSSIMAEDGNTFKVWITLLATCGSDGMSKSSEVFLSSICRISIDDVLKSVKKLQAPDELSRSKNDQGRRIERIDGGFRIINYQKYREFTCSNSPNAKRQKRYRERNALRPLRNASASASSSVSVLKDKEKIQEGKKERNKIPPSLGEVRDYCLERKNGIDPEKWFDHYASNGWKVGKNPMKDWQAAVRTWERSEYRAPEPTFHGVTDGRSSIEVEP